MYDLLTEGRWTRPHDRMAVYTEIEPGAKWGIRVTLFERSAVVEAIDSPKCTHYKTDGRLRSEVSQPNLWERLRGISFRDKVMAEVERKRRLAAEQNARLQGRSPEED